MRSVESERIYRIHPFIIYTELDARSMTYISVWSGNISKDGDRRERGNRDHKIVSVCIGPIFHKAQTISSSKKLPPRADGNRYRNSEPDIL